MRWAGHKACIGGMRNAYKIFFNKPERKRPRGRLIIKCISKKLGVRMWTGFI
jgi:hypothetical protein